MRCRAASFAIVPIVLLLTVACSSGSSSSSTVLTPTNTVFGSGVVVEEDRTLAAFDAVLHASEGNLHIEQGAQVSLRIRAEDNILPHLLSEVSGNGLNLRTSVGIDLQPSAPIDFFLTVTDLSRLQLSGVGDVDLDSMSGDQLLVVLQGVGDVEVDTVQANRLDLELRGVGDIEVGVATLAETLDVKLTGVGDIELSGTANDQRVVIESVGDYDGADMATAVADVTIRGLGSATVRVSTTLTVSIIGDGSVFYIGSPTVDSSVVGNGTVEQIPG